MKKKKKTEKYNLQKILADSTVCAVITSLAMLIFWCIIFSILYKIA